MREESFAAARIRPEEARGLRPPLGERRLKTFVRLFVLRALVSNKPAIRAAQQR